MVLFSERYWFLDSCESFFMDFFFLNGHPDSSCKFTKGLSWLSITKFKEFLYEKIVYLCSLSDCLSSYWILLHNNKCRLMLCKWASFISLIFCSACELQFQNVSWQMTISKTLFSLIVWLLRLGGLADFLAAN